MVKLLSVSIVFFSVFMICTQTDLRKRQTDCSPNSLSRLKWLNSAWISMFPHIRFTFYFWLENESFVCKGLKVNHFELHLFATGSHEQQCNPHALQLFGTSALVTPRYEVRPEMKVGTFLSVLIDQRLVFLHFQHSFVCCNSSLVFQGSPETLAFHLGHVID